MLSITAKRRTVRNIKRLKTIPQRCKRAIRRTFNDIKPKIKNRAKALMERPKSGNTYRIYVSRSGRRIKTGRTHIASSRSEPFAWMSGATFRSLRQIVPRWSTMIVGFGTPQAAWDKTGRTVLKRVLYGRSTRDAFENAFDTNMKREMHKK